jgi:TRAP-type C4-dicarboxylate transport system substrate-binding protein
MRVRLFAAALAIPAFAVPLGAAAQTKWDLATAYADTEFQTRNVRMFADDVRKLTGGKLDITVHSAGSLIKNPELKRSVQTGLVPMAEFFISNFGGENPMFEIDAIPYLAVNYKEVRHLWDVTRGPITDGFAKQGIRLLYAVPWPTQAFFTKEPVNSIADLKGKKMRTYNAQTARLASLLGVVPTTVQATEIPQAFSTGIIDLMYTAGQTGVSTRAWEYTKYFYDTGAWAPKNGVFVNEAAFAKLPADMQKALVEAAKIAEERGWKLSEEQNTEAPKVLAKNGMVLAPLSPAFTGELRKVGDVMLNDWLAKAGEPGKSVITEYRKHVPQAR